ncbi:hypothetical protein J6590_005330 [Homalodisca vitripennis]|nr:hypothetical protein J6590_005330 [Homalodisca vitripennis]
MELFVPQHCDMLTLPLGRPTMPEGICHSGISAIHHTVQWAESPSLLMDGQGTILPVVVYKLTNGDEVHQAAIRWQVHCGPLVTRGGHWPVCGLVAVAHIVIHNRHRAFPHMVDYLMHNFITEYIAYIFYSSDAC